MKSALHAHDDSYQSWKTRDRCARRRCAASSRTERNSAAHAVHANRVASWRNTHPSGARGSDILAHVASGATILMPGAIARDKSHGSRSRGTKYKRKEKGGGGARAHPRSQKFYCGVTHKSIPEPLQHQRVRGLLRLMLITSLIVIKHQSYKNVLPSYVPHAFRMLTFLSYLLFTISIVAFFLDPSCDGFEGDNLCGACPTGPCGP